MNSLNHHKSNNSKPNLTDHQRIAIYSVLLYNSQNGTLPIGIYSNLAAIYNVHPSTISRIWEIGQKSSIKDFNKIIIQKKANCGRKKKNWDLEKIKDIPIEKRKTLSQLSASSGIPKTSILRLVKSGKLRKNQYCYFYCDPN